MKFVLLGIFLFGVAVTPAHAEDARRQLVATGKLRVAIAVANVPSPLYVVRDGTHYRGVAVDLGRALASKLGVPVEFVAHHSTGEITDAANAGTWDVTFMPVDPERRKTLDFGAPYYVLESTYLAAPGSTIKTIADADNPDTRIAAVSNTATFRASARMSPKAMHLAVIDADAAIATIRDGKAHLMALGRDSLVEIATTIPGSRVLDGAILRSTTAVAVAKNKPAALAYVTEFVEEEKARGHVRRYFDKIGLKNATVAAAGAKP